MSMADDDRQPVVGSDPAVDSAADPAPEPAPDARVTPPPPPSEAPGQPGSGTAPGDPAPERETLIDAVADLLQMIVNYLRQETAGIMRDKVVLPGQRLGMLLAFAFAAATLLVIGLCFLFVSFLMVLAYFVGWSAAFAIVGAAILVGAGVLTYLKVRSIQT